MINNKIIKLIDLKIKEESKHMIIKNRKIPVTLRMINTNTITTLKEL